MHPLRTQRIMHECDNRLTNEDVEQSHRSKHVVRIRSLHKGMSDKVLTDLEMCDPSDYRLTMITLRTRTRPGALEHMTMAQYYGMKKDLKRGHFVILVTEHNRQVDGPAVISFTQELKEKVDCVLNNSGKALTGGGEFPRESLNFGKGWHQT